MRVIGKDRSGCDACNPLDEIIARLEQLERRVVTIVARVQGIPPDGEGNVTLPTSSSVDGPLYGNVGAFAMSSEVKEAADDVHQYASAIADDVVVLQSDVEILTREIEALDPSSVTTLQQSVAALQQSVNQLSNTVAGYSPVIGDLEDQLPNKVDRTGDTMTGPLNVLDTVTGSRNMQAVNGNRLQNDLDNYGPMVRTTGNKRVTGIMDYDGPFYANGIFTMGTAIKKYSNEVNKAIRVFEFDSSIFTGQYHTAIFFVNARRSNTDNKALSNGILVFTNNTNASPGLYWLVKGSEVITDNWVVTKEGSVTTCWLLSDPTYLNDDGVNLSKVVENRTAGAYYGVKMLDDVDYIEITDTGYIDSQGVSHTFTYFKRSI